MELERNEDRGAPERTEAERSSSSPEQTVFVPPFATDGLERIRDSHC